MPNTAFDDLDCSNVIEGLARWNIPTFRTHGLLRPSKLNRSRLGKSVQRDCPSPFGPPFPDLARLLRQQFCREGVARPS